MNVCCWNPSLFMCFSCLNVFLSKEHDWFESGHEHFTFLGNMNLCKNTKSYKFICIYLIVRIRCKIFLWVISAMSQFVNSPVLCSVTEILLQLKSKAMWESPFHHKLFTARHVIVCIVCFTDLIQSRLFSPTVFPGGLQELWGSDSSGKETQKFVRKEINWLLFL